MKHAHTCTARAAARGYTLTEVMVAITLSVFLLMGLFTILQQTRNASNESNGLSQLQDDERVAMMVLTEIIREAGYTPKADGSDTGLLVADGVFKYANQLFVGGAGEEVGDQLVMRYVLDTNDTTLTCIGSSNTAAKQVYKETFEIKTINGVSSLVCTPSNGTNWVPLVSNAVNLTFQYGVNTTSASSTTTANAVGPNTEASHVMGYGCPADTYITTANMSEWDWTNVCAVKVAITFINPLYQPQGQPNPTPGQPQYITFERVISVQTRTGVNVTTISQS